MTKFKIVGVKISENGIIKEDLEQLFDDEQQASNHITSSFMWQLSNSKNPDEKFKVLEFQLNDKAYGMFEIHEVEVGD